MKYVKENLSLQDKANYYNKLVKIYEKELTKSPKDRLLRLSRESIRKEIEFLKSKIPSINTQQSKSISYIGMTSFELSNEALKPKSILRDKLDRIKERKRQITDEEKAVLAEKRLKESGQISLVDINREKNRSFIVNLINEARNESQNYKYKEANKILLRALNMDFDNEFRIELCNLIAQNYNLLNEFQNALNYYEDALNCAIAENDSRICQIRCSIAQLNKKFYKNDEAKELFTAIAANQTYSDKYRAIETRNMPKNTMKILSLYL